MKTTYFTIFIFGANAQENYGVLDPAITMKYGAKEKAKNKCFRERFYSLCLG